MQMIQSLMLHATDAGLLEQQLNFHITSLPVLFLFMMSVPLIYLESMTLGEKKGFFKKVINHGSHISKVLNINNIKGGLNKYVTGEHFSGKS